MSMNPLEKLVQSTTRDRSHDLQRVEHVVLAHVLLRVVSVHADDVQLRVECEHLADVFLRVAGVHLGHVQLRVENVIDQIAHTPVNSNRFVHERLYVNTINRPKCDVRFPPNVVRQACSNWNDSFNFPAAACFTRNSVFPPI